MRPWVVCGASTTPTERLISGCADSTSLSENETERSSAAMVGWVKAGAGLLNWLGEARRATGFDGDGLRRAAGLRSFE